MATFDNRSASQSTTDGTSFTFSAVAIGTAASDRYVVAGFYARGVNGTPSISSVTIGGVSAAQAVVVSRNESGNIWDIVAIYSANVPTGTTADIVVTYNLSQLRCAYAVGTANGINGTASDTVTDVDGGTTGVTLSGLIDLASGGVLLAIAGTAEVPVGGATWTNATEFRDAAVGAENSRFTAAYMESASPETNRNVQCAWASPTLNSTFVAAAFQPTAAAATPPVVGRDLINSRFLAPRALVN